MISPKTRCFAAEPTGFDDAARSLAPDTIQRGERLIGSLLNVRLPIKDRTASINCSDGNVDGEAFRFALAAAVRQAA